VSEAAPQGLGRGAACSKKTGALIKVAVEGPHSSALSGAWGFAVTVEAGHEERLRI